MMRNTLILLALAVLATSSTGCSRCRGLLRRGAPCGGTSFAAAPMLGGAIPLGNPIGVRPAPTIMQPAPTMIAQPNCGCQQNVICQPECQCTQAAPICCEPCPTDCAPCDTGYIGGNCNCENIAPGEYFGGYVEGSAPPPVGQGMVMPQGSGTTFPEPIN